MALYNQFTSKQNKGLLWKLMGDNNSFDGIANDKLSMVREEFDTKIQNVGASIKSNDQLVTLNKRAIIELLPQMEKYKTTTVTAVTAARVTTSDATMVYNAGDLLQQRQKVFDNELKQKQEEFEKFNSKPVPDKIDFADKLDTPMGAEMDRILAEQIALREKQLTFIGPPPPPPADTKGLIATTPLLATTPLTQVLPTQLTIGEEINSNIIVSPLSPIRKKVNFIEPTTEDFMNLLKKTPPSDVSNETTQSVKDMLLEILNKQTQILALLQAKQ